MLLYTSFISSLLSEGCHKGMLMIYVLLVYASNVAPYDKSEWLTLQTLITFYSLLAKSHSTLRPLTRALSFETPQLLSLHARPSTAAVAARWSRLIAAAADASTSGVQKLPAVLGVARFLGLLATRSLCGGRMPNLVQICSVETVAVHWKH